VAQWLAFHNMRMEYERETQEMKKALRALEQPKSRFRIAEYADKQLEKEMDLLATREAKRNVPSDDEN
jgi:hypothetical protein